MIDSQQITNLSRLQILVGATILFLIPLDASAWWARYSSRPVPYKYSRLSDMGCNLFLRCDSNQEIDWATFYSPFPIRRTCIDYMIGIDCSDYWEMNVELNGTPMYTAHNWFINVAIRELSKRGLFLWDTNLEHLIIDGDTYQSSLEPIKFIHYGLTFADEPWLGRPNMVSIKAPSLVDGFINDGDIYHETGDTAEGFGYYKIKTTWKTNNTFQSSNPYLQAHLKVVLEGFVPNLVKIIFLGFLGETASDERGFSADNFYHFSNRELLEYFDEYDRGNIAFFKTEEHVDNEVVFKDSDIGAGFYGLLLYNLASKFWTTNTSLNDPSTDTDFIFAGPSDSTTMRTGKLRGYVRLPGDQFRAKTSPFPHTYLGGNPFICKYVEGDSTDPCEHGTPSWPIWVPDLEPEIDQSAFLASLSKSTQSKQDRVALIYLGWSLHMLTDLTMPQHTDNKTGILHASIEAQLDEIIFSNPERLYSSVLKQKISSVFGSYDAPISRAELCRDVDLAQMQSMFNEIKLNSLARGNEIDNADSYFAGVTEDAVIASMKMIACLGISQEEFTANKLVPVITLLLL